MNLEQRNAHEDRPDEEPEDAPRSIFAAGWLRAVLVLTVLALAVVVALPSLLNWFEPAPAGMRATTPRQASGPPPAGDSAGRPSAPMVPIATAPPVAPATSPPLAAARRADRTSPALTASLATSSVGLPHPGRVAAVSAPPADAGGPSGGRYFVQLGLFKDATNATHLAQKLRAQSVVVEVARVTRPAGDRVPAGTYHLVRAGGFRDRLRALAAREALREQGYAGFLTESAAP